MACCRMTNVLYFLLAVGIIAASERLIFDFIGGMFGSGTANIINLLVCVFATIVLFRRSTGWLLSTCIWHALWIAVNLIIILIYHEVVLVTNPKTPSDNYLLNFNTGHSSWWKKQGIDCEQVVNTTTVRYPTGQPEVIEHRQTINCLLTYELVETIQASIQIFLALILFCVTAHYVHVGLDDDSYESISGMSSCPPSHSPTVGQPVPVQMRPLPI